MPDAVGSDQKKSGLPAQILSAVVITLIAGGTAPWWFSALFSKTAAKSEAAPVQISRDFMIGHWQFRETAGSAKWVLDFSASGRVEGTISETGVAAQVGGTWDFEGLSDRSFTLWLTFTSMSDGTTKLDSRVHPDEERMKFEMSDRNHIRYVDEHNSEFLGERLH